MTISISKTALKKIDREIQQLKGIYERNAGKANLPDFTTDREVELRERMAQRHMAKAERNKKEGIKKRAQTYANNRLHRALGLGANALYKQDVGYWIYSKYRPEVAKLYGLKPGYWLQLEMPTLLPDEMAQLRKDLLKAYPDAGPGFCPSVQMGPHYGVEKILISDALVRRLNKTGQQKKLSSVMARYLLKAATRQQEAMSVTDTLNRLSGFPAWQASGDSTKYPSKSLRFICPLPDTPGWSDEYSRDRSGKFSVHGFIPKKLTSLGFNMVVICQRGDITAQHVSFYAGDEEKLKHTIQKLEQPPMAASLRRVFHHVAMVAFASDSMKIASKLSLEKRIAWESSFHQLEPMPRTGAQVLAHPGVSAGLKQKFIKTVPAAAPLKLK